MPIHLTKEKHQEIYQQIATAFSDFSLFDKLVSLQLRKVISDTDNVEIDMKTTRKVTERYFDTNQFQSEPQKLLLTQIQLILKTTYVLILSNSEESKKVMFKTIDELVQHYPQFENEDPEELNYLLKFRNYLKVALIIIPARLNKQLLIKIAARLEGSGIEYITGGGQKPCVTRRCDIYEKEGNVLPTTKPKNKTRVQTAVLNQQAALIGGGGGTTSPALQAVPNITGKKRTNNHASLRDVKLIRLTSEEIRHLAQGPSDPFSSNQNQGVSGGVNSSSSEAYPITIPPNTSIFQSQRNLTVIDDNAYPLQAQLSELSGISVLEYMNTEQSRDNLGEVVNYMPPSAYDQDLDVIQSLDELLELRKSDTIIDQLPPANSVHPHNSVIYVSQNTGVVDGANLATAGTLGNLSLSSTFPPPLQREHSDVLDRLFSENNELWSQISPTESNLGPPLVSEEATASTIPMQQLLTEPSVSSSHLPPPLQMMRSVSWDVYTGSFTEDLQFYLQQTNSVSSN